MTEPDPTPTELKPADPLAHKLRKRSRHTNDSIGERLEMLYAESAAFYAKAEARTDSALEKIAKPGVSILIVLAVLIGAMVIGDTIGIASVF